MKGILRVEANHEEYSKWLAKALLPLTTGNAPPPLKKSNPYVSKLFVRKVAQLYLRPTNHLFFHAIILFNSLGSELPDT